MENQKSQQNNIDREEVISKLHNKEIALILAIRREYRFGVIEIQTKDGLPSQILRTIDRKLLE